MQTNNPDGLIPSESGIDPITGGLIAAGISGVGGIINTIIGNKRVDKQTDANMELAKYAHSKDLEMWHLQNQYNTPSEQMKRFKAAGLNPNLIYGQGSPGNASQLPKYQQVRAERNKQPVVDVPQAIGAYQDVRMKDAQISNINANTNLTNKKANTEEFNSVLKEFLSEDQKRKVEALIAENEYELGAIRSQNTAILEFNEKWDKYENNELKREVNEEVLKWEKQYMKDYGVPPPKEDMWRFLFTTLSKLLPNWPSIIFGI